MSDSWMKSWLTEFPNTSLMYNKDYKDQDKVSSKDHKQNNTNAVDHMIMIE